MISSRLSKGNKQKLMICAALIREFDYLIADEPFTGLDPTQIDALRGTLKELKGRGKGIMVSTHLLGLVESLCDRYIMIEKGRIIARGTMEDLSNGIDTDGRSSTLESIYRPVQAEGRSEHRRLRRDKCDI